MDDDRRRKAEQVLLSHKAFLTGFFSGSVILLLTFLRQTDVDRFYHNHYRVGEGTLSQQLSRILISDDLQDKVKGAQLIVRLHVKHEDYVRVRNRLGQGLDRTTSVDNLLALPSPSRHVDRSSLRGLDLAMFSREELCTDMADDFSALNFTARQVQGVVQTTKEKSEQAMKEKSEQAMKVQLETMQRQVMTGRLGVDAMMKEVIMLKEKNEKAEKIFFEQKVEMNEKVKQLQETNKNMAAKIEELQSAKQPGKEEDPGKDPVKDPVKDPGKDPEMDPGKDPGKKEDPGKDPGKKEDPGKDPGKEEDPGKDPGKEEDPGKDPGKKEDPWNQTVSPDAAQPGAITIAEVTENTIGLTWAAAADTVDSYTVSICPTDVATAPSASVKSGDPLEHTFTSLTAGTEYTISVVPVSGGVNSVARTKTQRTGIASSSLSSSVNYSLDSDIFELIHERKKSVCRINWPGGSGTGFLLSKGKVLTCYRIYELMYRAFWSFPEASQYTATFFVSVEREYKVPFVTPAALLVCQSKDLDYAILQLAVGDEMERNLEGLPLLGHFISESGDSRRMVVLVGHPSGGSKVIDFAQIADEVQRNFMYIRFPNPMIQEDERKPLYKTSVMFHGSAGSPGFDTHGNMVLMHRRGFYPDSSSPGSIIEQGVRLSAIRDHARQTLAPEVFNEIFPASFEQAASPSISK